MVQILREGYTLPFQIRPNLARSPTVISCYVNPHRNLYLLEALHQLIDKNAVELVKQSEISGVFQPTIFSPKTKQQVEAYTRSEQIKSFPQGEKIQNGDTGNHQDIPPTRGVGYLNRLQGCLHHIPYTGTVQEISCPGSDIPVQSTTFRSVCSTLGVHLFIMRFNSVSSVSPVPDPMATAVDALSLPREDLDAYAFPPAA